jgi:hypothetical protein
MHPVQKRLQKQIKAGSTSQSNSDCWIWKRQISNSGYGKITVSDGNGTFTESADRMSYLAFNGPLNRDDIVRQTCGNRLCVNPDHLVLAGRADHGDAA